MFNDKKKILIFSMIGIVLLILLVLFITSKNESSMEIDFNSILEDEEQEKNISIEKEKEENILLNNVENIEEEEKNSEEIVIHIIGEVKKEGVIYLKKGARIIDAIKQAGGETKQADLSQVNLAYELKDGQKIYIPNKDEKISQYIIDTNGENISSSEENLQENLSSNKEEKKVNINTASQSELDSLPGIGPSLAQRIIEYREENGEFKNIEDIQNVKGIGNSKYEDIKEKIVV